MITHDTLYRIGRCCSIPPTREHDGMAVYGRIYSVEYPFLTIADHAGHFHSILASRVALQEQLQNDASRNRSGRND